MTTSDNDINPITNSFEPAIKDFSAQIKADFMKLAPILKGIMAVDKTSQTYFHLDGYCQGMLYAEAVLRKHVAMLEKHHRELEWQSTLSAFNIFKENPELHNEEKAMSPQDIEKELKKAEQKLGEANSLLEAVEKEEAHYRNILTDAKVAPVPQKHSNLST